MITVKYKEYKSDAINLAILVLIASALGFYLIVTTVMIAKDGVFYIERAQKLSSDPFSIIETHPPGYVFLVFLSHKFVSLFSDNSSVYTWIYSAQGVSLLCRVLALVPLYFIGKLLVGSRNSFWALLVLIFLPYPAEYGSDVLRDWPHILFLATGFLFLLLGSKQGKLWMFAVVGLAGGFGHTIRPECAQLMFYGVSWLLVGLFLRKRNMNRLKIFCALFVLLFVFAITIAPYIKVRGRILPRKLEALVTSPSLLQKEEIQEPKVEYLDNVYPTNSIPINILKAIGILIREISANLMHFFLPALLVGIYFQFYKRPSTKYAERFFISAFIIFNVIIMVLLYCSNGYMNRRHCVPLIVFTIFYVPIGFHVLSEWLALKFPKGRPANERKPQLWFFMLLITGLVICTPKLLRPIHEDKKAYKATAQWLKENTQDSDIMAVPDPRISFYSGRKGVYYKQNEFPENARYIVRVLKDKNILQSKDLPKPADVLYTDESGGKYRIYIYKNFD